MVTCRPKMHRWKIAPASLAAVSDNVTELTVGLRSHGSYTTQCEKTHITSSPTSDSKVTKKVRTSMGLKVTESLGSFALKG